MGADSLNCRILDGTDGHKTVLMITGIFSRSANNFGLIAVSVRELILFLPLGTLSIMLDDAAASNLAKISV